MKKPLLLATFALVAASALIAAAPPGLQPSPERLPGEEPCVECSIAVTEAGFEATLKANTAPGTETMLDLQLEVIGSTANATYDLADTHGLQDLEPGESAALAFEDPGFEIMEAKLHYSFEDGSYGTSTLDIE